MTMTNECDLFIEQGTDWSFDFPVDPTINLVGAAAAMMIRTRIGATFIATLTTANGGLTLGYTSNQITAQIANVVTSTFIPGDYVYDIKVEDTNNFVYRTNEGNVIVDGQVTYIIPPTSAGDVIGDASGNSVGDASGNQVGN